MTEKNKAKSKTPEGIGGGSLRDALRVPALAVLTGLIIGAFAILISGANVFTAYGALFVGSFGDPVRFYTGFQQLFSTGETAGLLKAIYPFTESLVTATPYIFAGLSVALGFRCGLFNIGAEGQFFIGALSSAFVGYSLVGLPAYIHLPLAVLAGAAGGALWGIIPGYLKAKFGAHEVVNTIMMNWIAFKLSDWLLNGPMKASGFRPVTPNVEVTAELPRFFPDPIRLNWGLILAFVVAYALYWFLFKTTLGFDHSIRSHRF